MSRALAEGQHLRKLPFCGIFSSLYPWLQMPLYLFSFSPLQDLTPSSYVAFTFVFLLFFFPQEKKG